MGDVKVPGREVVLLEGMMGLPSLLLVPVLRGGLGVNGG